ncbi:hypothetical protein [Thalassotalea maritima]|uniref:hypothetical protein n=1 Tax=Thalassotalea maritima TaxID=3242416 RepID=UPI00352748F4
MSKQITDQQLQQQIDALSKTIEPSRDLWLGVERAIEHQSQHQPTQSRQSNYMPMAWAASVVFAVLLTWQLLPQGQQPQPVVAQTPVEILQQQYQQQRETMLVSFGKPDISQLPNDIQQQFIELESARSSLLQALQDDPNNKDLLNLLKWTQQQELSLLEQLFAPKWQSI